MRKLKVTGSLMVRRKVEKNKGMAKKKEWGKGEEEVHIKGIWLKGWVRRKGKKKGNRNGLKRILTEEG
jgi:hypothetical protein